MSSRREVLIRILALLQRNTLTETKHCTLKCLKWHYWTVWWEKWCSVDRGRGICPLFSSPPRRDLTAQETPPPGICHSSQKKCLCPGISRGGGGAGHIWKDWCINGRPSWFWITLMDHASLSALDLDNLIWSDGKKEIVNSLRKNSQSLLFLSAVLHAKGNDVSLLQISLY